MPSGALLPAACGLEVPALVAFQAAGLLVSAGLLGVHALGPAGAVGLAEPAGELSAVSGAGWLVRVAWAELESPGTGSMAGMGLPNFVCSFKTFWCLAPRM